MTTSRIPGFGLDAPDHAYITTAFARHVGDVEARRLWRDSCLKTGIAPPPRHATPDELRTAIAALTSRPDLIGVTANALKVRLISYTMLARQAATATAGAR